MAIAVDLSSGFIDRSTDPGGASGSFAFGTGQSQDAFDLSGSMTLFVDDQAPIMGSWSGSVLNYGAVVVFTGGEALQSGSWFGSDRTWGTVVVFTGDEALQSGSWFGSDRTWGVNGASHENHDVAKTIDDEFPNVGEGINMGEYNPFPIPSAEPEKPQLQKIRDATRFQKAYSFTRNQPVRIRVFRR